MKNSIKALVRLYQIFISPTLPRSCRFYPSCSEYAIEAIEEHGLSSIFIIIMRIIRCNPWSNGGYDPIPKIKGKTNG